jgi:hypothetical protein
MAQEVPARPTGTEIHKIEGAVKLPHGAATLRQYVRYYYSRAKAGVRQISGIYIARALLKPSEIPATGIVVVGGDSEIPVPLDAECSVLFLDADPKSSDKVLATCSAGIFREK